MKRAKPILIAAAVAILTLDAAAARPVLEPKITDIPGSVFVSAKRVEGVEPGGGYVVVEGKRLYYGGTHTLYVYDIEDSLSPKLIGKAGGIGRIRQMAVRKGMVYIASRETGMWIVDARNPAKPEVLSRFDTVELATGISVCGNLVMLGQRQNGVEFIDVSDPYHPEHILLHKTDESQSTLFKDGICYSGDWGAGEVTMIDARDMRSVKTLRTIKLRGNGDGIDLQGNLLYCSTGHHYHDTAAKYRRTPKMGERGFGEGHALEIIDIADPESPRVLGRCKFDTFYAIGMDMWMPRASGDHVFCADTYNGLYSVDARDPAAMRIDGRLTIPNPARDDVAGMPVTGVAVADGAVYVAASDCGLVVVECPVARGRAPSYPEQPANLDYRAPYSKQTNRFDVWVPKRRGQVRAAASQGDYVYVACGQAGLGVLKREGKSYSEVASIDLPFCGDVKVRDGKLYSAEALQGLAVYDLANPEKPRELERVTDFGAAICCPLWIWTPQTTNLVIVSDRESGYTIMEPGKKWRKIFRNGGCPGWDRYFSNELVGGRYFAQSFANVGFCWIDMAQTPPKTIRSRVNTSGLNDGCIAWRGDRLLLVSKGELLYLEPGQKENADGTHWRGIPLCRKGGDGPYGGQPAWNGGNLLALTARISKKVWKLDIADENNPKPLWGESVVGNPDLAVFHDDRLLVPCGYQGLLIEKDATQSAAKIVLVGDSTLAPRNAASPIGSWGEALSQYLREDATIRDFAVGGRTVRTTLPSWDKTLAAIEKGDHVIIQFGINDAAKSKFVDETEFVATLERFIRDVRAKGAYPLVCSPVANAGYRKNSPQGSAFRLEPDRETYGGYARRAAANAGAEFLDMTAITSAALSAMSRADAIACFAGDVEREGKMVFDTTHPSKHGSCLFAELFHREAKARKLRISELFTAYKDEGD